MLYSNLNECTKIVLIQLYSKGAPPSPHNQHPCLGILPHRLKINYRGHLNLDYCSELAELRVHSGICCHRKNILCAPDQDREGESLVSERVSACVRAVGYTSLRCVCVCVCSIVITSLRRTLILNATHTCT